MGSHVDASLDDLACGELDGQDDVVGGVESVVAVDQSLVQIEDNSLFVFDNLKRYPRNLSSWVG